MEEQAGKVSNSPFLQYCLPPTGIGLAEPSIERLVRFEGEVTSNGRLNG